MHDTTMNPYYIEILLREKRQELLREALNQKLIAQYEAANPPKRAKMLAALGELLIRFGEKLRSRYGTPAHALAIRQPYKNC